MGQHRRLRTQPRYASQQCVFDKAGALRAAEYTQQGPTPHSVLCVTILPSGTLHPSNSTHIGTLEQVGGVGLKLKIWLAGPLLDGQEAGGRVRSADPPMHTHSLTLAKSCRAFHTSEGSQAKAQFPRFPSNPYPPPHRANQASILQNNPLPSGGKSLYSQPSPV